MEGTDVNIYGLFADILEYPTSRTSDQARECVAVLEPMGRKVKDQVEEFVEFCVKNPLSRLEELYTETFDLQPVCCPHIGYHLFGEDRRRGAFMVKLKEHYRGQDYPLNGELPDHISVMLKFLSVSGRSDETCDLINYCLIPAVKKMISLFRNSGNPYKGVLQALLKALEADGRDHSAMK